MTRSSLRSLALLLLPIALAACNEALPIGPATTTDTAATPDTAADTPAETVPEPTSFADSSYDLVLGIISLYCDCPDAPEGCEEAHLRDIEDPEFRRCVDRVIEENAELNDALRCIERRLRFFHDCVSSADCDLEAIEQCESEAPDCDMTHAAEDYYEEQCI